MQLPNNQWFPYKLFKDEKKEVINIFLAIINYLYSKGIKDPNSDSEWHQSALLYVTRIKPFFLCVTE